MFFGDLDYSKKCIRWLRASLLSYEYLCAFLEAHPQDVLNKPNPQPHPSSHPPPSSCKTPISCHTSSFRKENAASPVESSWVERKNMCEMYIK